MCLIRSDIVMRQINTLLYLANKLVHYFIRNSIEGDEEKMKKTDWKLVSGAKENPDMINFAVPTLSLPLAWKRLLTDMWDLTGTWC